MNEQAINSIKEALRQMMQLIVQRGEPLSEELKIKIAQVMDHAANRITQLRQQGQQDLEIESIEKEQKEVSEEVSPDKTQGLPPSGGQVPELEPAPHESSNINAFRYDPETQKLFVKFQGKFPAQNGPVYQYEGVPSYIYDVFSRGAVAPKTSGKNAWHRWREGIAPSHGASMYALIKNGGFSYKRMS